MTDHEPMWLIWSEEHGAWWRPGKGGYTTSIVQAGRYTEGAARLIVGEANRYVKPPTYHEAMFPETSMLVPR